MLDFLEVVLSSIVSSGFPSELGEERQVSSQGSFEEFEELAGYLLDETKEAKSLLIALLLRDRVIG